MTEAFSGPIRVRFAPSPTGYLHVGGARTALFNWLLARRHGGTFVLRIEDTDVERSSEEMVTGILDGLRWLGLDWDEGPVVGGPHAPYFQSERLERYRALASRLVEDGHAYYCYCSAETLQKKRDEAQARGESTQYDRTCLTLAPEEIAQLEATGAARAIRFKVPPGRTQFLDLVHGAIDFDNANIEDFVILRSDTYPTYHLSVVADDVDMGITQVIRGDDHISNTPKHVLLFEALGMPVPKFAHVPLILGTDKKRLSKRHGATSVMEYARLGLPAGSDDELPGAARLVAGQRRSGVVHARGADRRVRAGGHQRRQRGVQSGKAGLDERPAHHAPVGRTNSRRASNRGCATRDCGTTRSPRRRARGARGCCR